MNHLESGEIKQSFGAFLCCEGLCPNNKRHREKQIKQTK